MDIDGACSLISCTPCADLNDAMFFARSTWHGVGMCIFTSGPALCTRRHAWAIIQPVARQTAPFTSAWAMEDLSSPGKHHFTNFQPCVPLNASSAPLTDAKFWASSHIWNWTFHQDLRLRHALHAYNMLSARMVSRHTILAIPYYCYAQAYSNWWLH